MPCAEAPAEPNVASDEALERPRHARYRAKSGKQPGKLSRAGHISGEAPGSSPEQLGAVGGDATRDVGLASATSQTQELALVARREAAGTHATRLTKHGGSHAGPPPKVMKQADKTTVPKSAQSAYAAAPQDLALPTAPAVAGDAADTKTGLVQHPGLPPMIGGGQLPHARCGGCGVRRADGGDCRQLEGAFIRYARRRVASGGLRPGASRFRS